MSIGEKLKQARLEAGLSQRQLCDDRITRNMLSQIENGTARPSMQTLRYLADRLGKSVGWFLEETAVLSPNQERITRARASYEIGQYAQVLATLADFAQPDAIFQPEKDMLSNLARLALARQAVAEGRLPYARQLLEGIVPGLYWTDVLAQEAQFVLAAAGADADLACPDERLYLLARQTEDAGRAQVLLQAMELQTDQSRLLMGQLYARMAQWEAAIECLKAVENVYPAQAVPVLEQCYRELGDYKMAYFYACKQK